MRQPVVVQITPAFLRNPNFGGPVTSALELAKVLQSAGFDVRVVSSWFPLTGRFCLAEVEISEGMPVLYLGHILKFRWSSIDFFGLMRAARWIRESDLVVVHGFRGFAGTLLTLYAGLFNKACWIYPHGMVRRKFRSFAIKRVFDETFGRLAARQYSTALVHSEIEERELSESLLSKCKIVRLLPRACVGDAKDIGSFRKKYLIESEDILVVFVGRILKIKNLHSLLEAFCLVKASHWKLCYIGPIEDSSYARELVRLAQRLGCSSQFQIIGPLYGSEKDNAIQDADLCALPSSYESFGHFAWEAAALRKPLVVSNKCGVASALGDAAQIADCSPVSLAEAIQRALIPAPRTAPQVSASDYWCTIASALQATTISMPTEPSEKALQGHA